MPVFAASLADLVRWGAELVFACTPRPALSITPGMLCILHRHCGHLGHCGLAPWDTLALGYFTLLRQSNLLSPALGGWGDPHTNWRQDVVPAPCGLQVTIASSKTLKTQA